MSSRLKAQGKALQRDGAVEQRFAGADVATRAAPGPLLTALLDMTGYGDEDAADLLCHGAPLHGHARAEAPKTPRAYV
eukprot:5060984-Pyramimonas_sp.AAC.1